MWMPVLLLLVACSGEGAPVEAGTDDTGAPSTEAPLATADVVVIGAGPAGMAAAIEIADAGADVVVLERTDLSGGAARWSGALMMFSGSPLQADLDVADSPETLLEEWAAMTGGDPDDPWVRRYAEDNVPEVYAWLSDMGATWLLSDEESPGSSVHRVHAMGGLGEALVDTLYGELPEDAVAFEVDVTGLVEDEDGVVIGVAVDGELGEGWIAASAVIAATGGFLRDPDLVAQVDPALDLDQTWSSSGPEADGSGHRMLEAVGATWDNPGGVSIYGHGMADPRFDGEELLLRPLESTVWVDRDGARFVDEADFREFETGLTITELPGQLAWAVLDAQTWVSFAVSDPMELPNEEGVEIPDKDALVDEGHVLTGATLGDLALALGVDAGTFEDEIARFNAAVVAGEGDAFRDDLEDISSLDAAPFYGVRVVPALAKAFGGIEVDTSGRVVDADGQAIPGLYAAGELTGMAGGSLVGDRGWTGSLSAVLLSGRIAGQAAADEVLTAE